MNKKWLAAAAIALVVGVPAASKILRGPPAKEVETERAAQRVLTPSILASGTLTYGSQATLVSEVIGRVDAVLVKEGDTVVRGQLLLRLDGEAARAEIAQLSASSRQAELNVERQRVARDAAAAKIRRYTALRELGLVEATRYDEFLTEKEVAEVEVRAGYEAVKQAQALLLQARQRLTRTEIRAPIGGKVTSVSIKLGETAVPSAMSIAGSNLLVISDTRTRYAEINVDEADIARIAQGQEARIFPAAFPDRSLKGRVEQVATVPRQNSGQSRSYAVRVRLDTADAGFHPGMSCRAEIALSGTGGPANLGVPVQAVQYEEAEHRDDRTRAAVFVMEQGKALRREVRTGTADDHYIEVLQGLKPDEVVVVGPPRTLRFLRDGEMVRAKASALAAAAGASGPQ
jgi:HlyD family secretion protein